MQLIVLGYHIFLLHKTSIWTVSWREPRLTRRRSIVAVADDDPMILKSLGLLLDPRAMTRALFLLQRLCWKVAGFTRLSAYSRTSACPS